jgi:uracil DNA glycosylase
VISINAHSLSFPVQKGIAVARKIGNISKDGEEAFKVSDTLTHNLQLGWKAKGVATSLYHDAKEAF